MSRAQRGQVRARLRARTSAERQLERFSRERRARVLERVRQHLDDAELRGWLGVWGRR